MALKIDRLDSKKCTPETATKSYIEVNNNFTVYSCMYMYMYVAYIAFSQDLLLLLSHLPHSSSLSLPLSLSFSPPSSHSLPSPPPPQVRAEVSLLHKLSHPHVIDFIGVVLKPLCFILEWACGGSLHSVLTKYCKVDGRVGPLVLQQATLQVYIHVQCILFICSCCVRVYCIS